MAGKRAPNAAVHSSRLRYAQVVAPLVEGTSSWTMRRSADPGELLPRQASRATVGVTDQSRSTFETRGTWGSAAAKGPHRAFGQPGSTRPTQPRQLLRRARLRSLRPRVPDAHG